MKSIYLEQMIGGGLAVGTLYLGGSDGPGVDGEIKAGRLGAEKVLPSGLVEQEIELQLVGAVANIEVYLAKLGRLLAEAGRTAEQPGGAGWVYLGAQRDALSDVWRSKVYGGRIVLDDGAEARSLRSQRVRVVVERADWWEGSLTALTMTNGGDMGPGGEAFVWNHDDGGAEVVTYLGNNYNTLHHNWFENSTAIEGELPTPARLELGVSKIGVWEAAHADESYNFFVAHSVFRQQDTEVGTFEPVEAINPAEVAIAADAQSSGGSYSNFTWNGENGHALFDVTISAAQAAAFSGRPCKVFVRLVGRSSSLASERFYMTWYLAEQYGLGIADVIFDGEQQGGFIGPNAGYLDGPVFHLPAFPVNVEFPSPATALRLRFSADPPAGSVGAHNLKVDYACIFPLDGWRRYVGTFRGNSGLLRDYCDVEAFFGYDGKRTHRQEGPGFVLYPGRQLTNRFYLFAWHKVPSWDESHCYPDFCYAACITYRPRKRAI